MFWEWHQITDVIPSLCLSAGCVKMEHAAEPRRLLTEEQGLQGRDPCQGVIVGRGPGGSWMKLGLALRDWVWQRGPYPRRGHSAGPLAGQRGCFQYRMVTAKETFHMWPPWDLNSFLWTRLHPREILLKLKGCLIWIIAPIRGENWRR